MLNIVDPLTCMKYGLLPSQNNLNFTCCDFVTSPLNLLKLYDLILCLSLTKWIHLDHGDSGIKLLFKKCYLLLNKGGILLLEIQPIESYQKRTKLSEKYLKNYESIKLKPVDFTDYLLNVIGFSRVEDLGSSSHESKGFRRPLLAFVK